MLRGPDSFFPSLLPEEIRGLRLPGDGRDDGVERGQA